MGWKPPRIFPGMLKGHGGDTSIRKVLAIYFGVIAFLVIASIIITVRHMVLKEPPLTITDQMIRVIEILPYVLLLIFVFIALLIGILTIQNIIDFWTLRKFNRPAPEPPKVNVDHVDNIEVKNQE